MSNTFIIEILRRFLVCAIAVAAFGILSASAAQAQATWIVIASTPADSSSSTPDYHISYTGKENCDLSSAPTLLPGDMYVCPGDKIYWTACTTPGSVVKNKCVDSSNTMKSEMFIFQEDGILIRENASSHSHGFHARNPATPSSPNHDGGTTDLDVDTGVPHEYYVFLHDQVTNKLYVQDPTIKFGSGSSHQTLASLLQNLNQQVRLLVRLPNGTSPARKMATDQALKDIAAMQKLLKPQQQ
jgi:hypothetical protein